SPDERALTEVNSGIYVFRADLLWPALERLSTANDQGELYLTDAVGLLVGDGHTVAGHLHDDPTVALGINTRADLAAASALLRDRINLAHMLAGVTIVDPASTWIEPTVSLAADATIGPFCYLRPGAELADDAKAGTFVEIKNSQLAAGVKVPHLSYIGDASIGEG